MDEATWDVCPDPFEMLNFLQSRGRGSDRKLRLVCCTVCRAVAHLLTDKRYRAALDVAERYADGLASLSELRRANGVVVQARDHIDEYEWSEDKQGVLWALNAVSWATLQREPPDPPDFLAWCAASSAKSASVWEESPEAAVHASQSALLRDILGNPFRPVALDPAWLTWHGGTIRKLALSAYEDRELPSGHLDTHHLAVLADALEDAGCTDPDLLGHCRGPGPHVRGCWVIDLLLGRK
jgi:hypothetical protein